MPIEIRSETKGNLPLLTVGIVVFNREWIIGKILESLIDQSYPHEKIFVVIADGGSKDKTIEVAKDILKKSDFLAYEIISKECSIPEGRNICIEKMQGDMLLFWDSDIIMEPNAVRNLVDTMLQKKVGIVSADGVFVYINSITETEAKMQEALARRSISLEDFLMEIPGAGMGHTLISKNVLNSIRFDTDLTTAEDLDFSVRAREKGFKIVLNKRVLAFDINVRKKGYSDIHVDMPFKRSLKGLRKKAKAHVLAYSCELTSRNATKFFIENKRYIFYLGYIPAAVLTVFGLTIGSYLFATLPVYLLLFAFWQLVRRGVARGAKAVLKSIVVGVPFSLWLVYYFCKYILKKTAA